MVCNVVQASYFAWYINLWLLFLLSKYEPSWELNGQQWLLEPIILFGMWSNELLVWLVNIWTNEYQYIIWIVVIFLCMCWNVIIFVTVYCWQVSNWFACVLKFNGNQGIVVEKISKGKIVFHMLSNNNLPALDGNGSEGIWNLEWMAVKGTYNFEWQWRECYMFQWQWRNLLKIQSLPGRSRFADQHSDDGQPL